MAEIPRYATLPPCIHCGSNDTSIIYSPGPARNRKLRWRRCNNCSTKFKTIQKINPLGEEISMDFTRGLHPDEVREIRQELKKGKPHQLIADFHAVSRGVVTNINIRKSYKHVI